MTDQFNHETYLSPFTWRYGSDAMREIWSDVHKRKLWRKLWVALAEVQSEVGLVKAEQVDDLRANVDNINIARATEIEAELHHDLMAEVHTYAEQCPIGGGIIHLGATSMDIEDNADALRLKEALDIIIKQMGVLLSHLADVMEREADHVCMAFTHLQPAEPTTIGYRMANYAQDLLIDYQALLTIRDNLRGKGFKGAVGTAASYGELLHDKPLTAVEMEAQIMERIGLEPFFIAHQTYPRRQDWDIVNGLAGVAMTLYRFAFDLRLLQSPVIGEWAEPFGSKQIGSSAMPFKRNPINSENIDSLARYVATLPRVLWDNAAHSLLERTLDDSGNRRAVLPDAFLATDEIIKRGIRLLKGLQINAYGVKRNLETYGVFAATERVLMEVGRRGGDRQEMHEVIRENSLKAWEAVRQGLDNPLLTLLCEDERVLKWLDASEVPALLEAHDHIGIAPERAKAMAGRIREGLMS